jgi:hypothetical protein
MREVEIREGVRRLAEIVRARGPSLYLRHFTADGNCGGFSGTLWALFLVRVARTRRSPASSCRAIPRRQRTRGTPLLKSTVSALLSGPRSL